MPAHFITQGHRATLRYLSYLYFGKIEDNQQSFTLRDLGLRKTPDFKADYSARFDTRPEAQAAYFYADALHKFKFGTEAELAAYIDSVASWPNPQCDISEASRDKLLQKLGGLSERFEDIETALRLYRMSNNPLCNERAIRLRYKRGDKDWCKARLEELIENPGSDEVTDILRSGESLRLDEAFKNSPERAAQKYYEAQGYEVFFTENRLWRTLFGLLFWEELYCSENAALHSSFEKTPASLKTGRFYSQFESAIETKLSSLKTPSKTHIQIWYFQMAR